MKKGLVFVVAIVVILTFVLAGCNLIVNCTFAVRNFNFFCTNFCSHIFYHSRVHKIAKSFTQLSVSIL